MKQNKIILALVLIAAFFLRAYKLDSYPALNPDEAALGYNAYSLIKTGRDEHGAIFPLHFKSFGDYKPGGYVYFAIPFIYLLDLSTLSVRIPNLILSLLSIYFIYKIFAELTQNEGLSLVTSFLLAISPWHIHFSRGAWESSSALGLTIIGTYLYIKNRYILSALLFSLSMYTYHSSRIFTPLLILALIIIQRKVSKIFIFLLILTALPAFVSFLTTGGSTRFGGVGIVADQGPVWRANELINNHANTKLITRIVHNKRILYGLSWIEKYTSHFDLNYLFINGDAVPRSKIPDLGQSYLFLAPFFLYGVFLLQKSKDRRLKILIFSWLLLSPIASSLTFQAPSALRSFGMVIPLEFLNAYGLYHFIKKIHRSNVRMLTSAILTTTFIFSVCFYLNSYYNRYSVELPTSWPWQAEESIEQKKYTQIDADQPYIMYLFYTKYDPARLQPQIKLTTPDKFGFSTVDKIDDVIFRPIK